MNEGRLLERRDILALEKEAKPFSDKIRQIRSIMNMSRQEFAEHTGFTPVVIRNWEQEYSKPGLEHVYLLIKKLGLTFEALFSYELNHSETLEERHLY